MKKLLSLMACAAIFALAACSDGDDDDDNVATPQAAKAFIETKYPGAAIRHSEYERSGLLEVEILHDSRIKDVFFNSANEWVKTDWDVSLAELPTAVTDAVSAEYSGYRIDDADYEESPDGVYYELELDRGDNERYIYVTPEGVILEHAGVGGGGLSSAPQAAKAFVETKYPGATIRHSEYEQNGLLEVEILHDSRVKDVFFNSANEWVRTDWDVSIAELPAAVTDAVSAEYSDYRIDDADYEERPNGVYYKLELERGNYERYVYVTPEGVILENLP